MVPPRANTVPSLQLGSPPIKLPPVNLRPLTNVLLVGALVGYGCGSGDSDGTGGIGGDALFKRSTHSLTCTIDPLVLELPIELSYELNQAYVADTAVDLAFSATVILTEETTATLIDAGIDKVDIISVRIASWVEGAAPTEVETTFLGAPINDFDLERDPEDDGQPGPHRIELERVVVMSRPTGDSGQVELGLRLAQVSIVLGDFEVPDDCQWPTLVGVTVRFPVGASD